MFKQWDRVKSKYIASRELKDITLKYNLLFEIKTFSISAHDDGRPCSGSAHARPSALPPIDISGHILAHMSARLP